MPKRSHGCCYIVSNGFRLNMRVDDGLAARTDIVVDVVATGPP